MVLLSTKSYIVIGQMIKDGILENNVFDELKYYIGSDYLKRLRIECKHVKDHNMQIESVLFAEKFPSHAVYEEYESFTSDLQKIR
jgi:hypothetical protein